MSTAYELILADIRSMIREEVANLIQPDQPTVPGVDFTQYISLKRASEELGVSSQTLRAHKEKIGYTKQFGQIIFKRQDLVDYIESGRPVPESRIMFTRRR